MVDVPLFQNMVQYLYLGEPIMNYSLHNKMSKNI